MKRVEQIFSIVLALVVLTGVGLFLVPKEKGVEVSERVEKSENEGEIYQIQVQFIK